MKKGEGKLALELTQQQDKVKTFLDAKYTVHESQKTVDKYTLCLAHFQTFLNVKYPGHTIESILPSLSQKKIPVYTMLNGFVKYLKDSGISAKSTVDYMTGVRSFLLFESEYEIDISRFKDRVSLPSPNTEYEQAIDATTIRNILNSCNNRRLKAFLYLLSTSGLRSMEAISLRNKDVELSSGKGEPSIIHVRKEYSKSRRPRNIFITDEATEFVKQWLDYKYRKRVNKEQAPEKKDEHVIFSFGIDQYSFTSIYMKLNEGFKNLLASIDLDERKEGMLRHRITFHSFRRFVKTTLTDQVHERFAEFILGHKNDMGYYTKRPEEAFQNYRKVMPYLTFTDYSALESHGRSIEAKLSDKDKQIAELKKKLEELRQQTTDEFKELEEGLSDRVLEKITKQLDKNGWLKENDKKILIKQKDFDYEITPGRLDKEEIYVKKEGKGIIQVHRLRRKK